MKHSGVRILHMSVWVLIARLLLVEIVFVGGYLLLRYFPDVIGWDFTLGVVETFIFHLVEVFFLVYVTLLWGNTIFTISQDSISVKKGIFNIRQNAYNTANIESVKVRQSFGGVLFRYGTIILSAPTLKETIPLPFMSHPKTLADEIEAYMKQSQSRIIPVDAQ